MCCVLLTLTAVPAEAQFFDGFNSGKKSGTAPQTGFGFLFGEQPSVEPQRPRIIIRRSRRQPDFAKSAKQKSNGSNSAVFCVRTCDGFYFPLQTSKLAGGPEGQKKICKAMCPGSPTIIYSARIGSDIEGSVDIKGNSYSKLSTALRFRKETTPGCSCQSQLGDGLADLPITQDTTLKKGDMVVSRTGVRTFQGSERFPYSDNDFSKPQDVNNIRRR